MSSLGERDGEGVRRHCRMQTQKHKRSDLEFVKEM